MDVGNCNPWNMFNDQTLNLSRNATAIVLAIGAVVLFSLYPALVGLADVDAPYLFASTWRMGAFVGYGIFVLVGYRDLIFDKSVWRVVWSRVVSWAMLFWVVAFFDIPLYMLSAGVIDVAATAVLYETWPIMLVLLMSWLFRGEGRYLKVGPFTLFAFVLAVVGVALVITSQVGGLGGLRDLGNTSAGNVAMGAGLAFGAAGMTALTGIGFRWGADTARELPTSREHNRSSLEVFGVVSGSLVGCALSLPVMAGVGLGRGESIEYGTLIFGLVCGPFITALPSILWRKAMLLTDNLGVGVLMYLTPLLGICWLLALSLVGPIDITLLVFGAVVIVAGNIGVYLEGRQAARSSPLDLSSKAVITAGESDTVEFKAAMRMNRGRGRVDKRFELVILKTLAAFMNTEGGVLVIGVGDDRSPVGIAVDGFDTEDKMNLHLRHLVSARMGPTTMAHAHTSFEDYQGVRIMVVRCDPAGEPIYLRGESGGDEFYIRAGPSSTRLFLKESVEYIRERFR